MNIMKPILFNTEMVRATLDGKKTQMRLIIKNVPQNATPVPSPRPWNGFETDDAMYHVKPPYYPGDILYVRETWNVNNLREDGDEYEAGFIYKAAEKPDYGFRWVETSPESYEKYMDGMSLYFDKWRPSIHMPKEAARIFLRVTDVRVERLQEISEADIGAEGVCPLEIGTEAQGYREPQAYYEAFAALWDSTIKKADRDRFGWDANPWVWVFEFERCEKDGE